MMGPSNIGTQSVYSLSDNGRTATEKCNESKVSPLLSCLKVKLLVEQSLGPSALRMKKVAFPKHVRNCRFVKVLGHLGLKLPTRVARCQVFSLRCSGMVFSQWVSNTGYDHLPLPPPVVPLPPFV